MNNMAMMGPQNMNMNSQMMLDNFKSMMLTMAMVKGSTNQTDQQSSFMNAIIMMILVSFIDTIVVQLKSLFNVVGTKFNNYISKKTKDISLINHLSLSKTKKTSIIVKVEVASKNPTSDAIIDLLTHLPYTKCILLQNGIYSINYSEEIEISKGLYAQLVNSSSFQMASGATFTNTIETNEEKTQQMTTNSANTNVKAEKEIPYCYIDIYSYTMDMEFLRNELNTIVKNYLIKMTNKLGNNIYYFSELPLMVYRDNNGKVDNSKTSDCLQFTMKPFVTNRSFKNIFGNDIDIVRKRVEFFRDNKDWYDAKGVPYTLGILVSGSPGTGKTSLIKCMANELKRHIINIHLSETMTKGQIENLFYSEQIHVTQHGKTETYTIPINKRIYVLEDVDCQCEIILDRGNETAEQILAKKNAELKEEVERLKYTLNELSNGRKMVMTGGKMPTNLVESKKDENSDQKITLSFLLNLFDGVLETPGRITFMTTNFVDKLDKAFTRPGRIDVISKFGLADHSQLIAIIEHRYDVTLTTNQLNIIYNLHPCITPAEISRILFENFNNLDGALQGLVNYVDEYMMKDKTQKIKDEATKMKVLELEIDAETQHNAEAQNKIETLNKVQVANTNIIPKPVTNTNTNSNGTNSNAKRKFISDKGINYSDYSSENQKQISKIYFEETQAHYMKQFGKADLPLNPFSNTQKNADIISASNDQEDMSTNFYN